MKKHIFLGFLLLLLAFGCRKSLDEISTVTNPHTPLLLNNYTPTVENIVSSVAGTVYSESGALMPEAEVTLGSMSTLSDEFGVFKFENVTMNKVGTFVEVKKQGFFSSGRRFYPLENETSVIKIELMEQSFSQNFESTIGASINIPGEADPLGNPADGGEIIFQPNSIQQADGSIYNGNVQVAARWLNPTKLSTFDRMPGALEGVNISNEEVGLITYGMVGVELQGSNGEELNIAEGKTAEININVPTSLLSSAPAEIPLWSFNETYGIWVEEGKALLQNDVYVGEVTHFSFWNVDVPRDFIHFEAVIIEENTGALLSNTMVKISLPNGAGSEVAYSNNQGIVSGFIPKNENLLLEIFSNCGDVIHAENIGPFATDVSFGEIQLPESNITTISGEILDCNGALASEGMVILKYDNQYITRFIDSNPFSFSSTLCGNASQLEIIVGNLENQQQSDPVILPINNDINVGSLAACGQMLMNTCKITVDGTTRYYVINSTPQFPDTITPFLTELNMFNQPNVPAGDTLICGLTFNHTTGVFPFPPGDYSIYNGVTVIIDTENEWRFTDNAPTGQGFSTFIVEEYGTTYGTIVSGYMSGNLINSASGQDVSTFVEGEFTAIRSQ